MLRTLRAVASFLALALQVARLGTPDLQSFQAHVDDFVSSTQAYVSQASLWSIEPVSPAPAHKQTAR